MTQVPPLLKQVPATLKQETASLKRDSEIYNYSDILYPQDATLLSRGGTQGLKLYDEIERDGHAYAVLQKRKMAVTAREVLVESASKDDADNKARDLVEKAVKQVPFDNLCYDLLDALLKGIAVIELKWGVVDGMILPVDYWVRRQNRFVFDVKGRLKLLTKEHPVKGIHVPQRKFIVHRFNNKDSNFYGVGLGSTLFWYVYFKKQGVKFWLNFADKFATPTPVASYPQGMSQQDQDTLLETVARLHQTTGVTVPQGVEVTLLEASRSGGGDTYEKLCRYMDEQISETVLGETLSTNLGGGGSLAAAKVHEGVRQELADADCDLLTDTLHNTFSQWIIDLNFPQLGGPHLDGPKAKPPRIWRRPTKNLLEDANLKKENATWLKTLADAGYAPKDPQELQSLFDMEITLKTVQEETAPTFAETQEGDSDFMEETEQLLNLTHDAIVNGLNAVKDLLDQAPSLEAFQEGLLKLESVFSREADLTQTIGDALATVTLKGRADVKAAG